MLFPLFKDQKQSLWVKIVRPIVGFIAYVAAFFVGLYTFALIALIITLLIVGVIIYWALDLFGFIMKSDSEERKKEEERRKKETGPHYDCILDNGTKLTQTDIGGYEFRGNDGYRYEKDDYGNFTRINE